MRDQLISWRKAHRKQLRFRKEPATYLAALGDTFLKTSLLSQKKISEKTGNSPTCPGQWHDERYEDGWSPGSCCGAIRERGQSSLPPIVQLLLGWLENGHPIALYGSA